MFFFAQHGKIYSGMISDHRKRPCCVVDIVYIDVRKGNEMAQTKKNTKNSGKASSASAKSSAKGKTKNDTSKGAKKTSAPKKEPVLREDTPYVSCEDSFVHQLTPYLVALFALLLAVCIIAGEGKIGGGVRSLFAGLFSGAAYVLPVFILIRAFTWRRDIEDGAFAARTVCLFVVYVLLASLLHILGGGAKTLVPAVHFVDGRDFVGGGFFGGLVGELLVRGFGKVCSLIILFAAMALLILYVAGMTPRSVLIWAAYNIKVAMDKRRTRLEERRDPSRQERQRVREEEYLRYLREKRRRQLDMQAEEGLRSVAPAPTPASEPTVYRVKRKRIVLPDEQITDGKLQSSPETDTVPDTSETIVSGGHIVSDSRVEESVFANDPETSEETVPVEDEKADGGALDERIFDEVMRRTRERIEKSRRTEGIRETVQPQTTPIPVSTSTPTRTASVVTVDTETGEVIENANDRAEQYDELLDSMFTEERLDDGAGDFTVVDNDTSAEDEPSNALEDTSADEDYSTDSVAVAASVASAGATAAPDTDADGYNVSDIFVDPADAELIDRLSDEHRRGTASTLDVRRGVIADATTREAPREKVEVPDYKYPPIELLTEDTSTGGDDIKDELQENAVKLVETLESFNVKTKIENISRGPTITRYELHLDRGVRVRSITNLVDDIALNLATKGVRIEAPIPGKSAVGIEVPNKKQSTVHLRTLLCDERFVNAKSKLTICLGEDVAGEAVFFDIAKFPHLLIAGTTGSGKSVCINSIIMSLLYKASPEDVKMILIDPKKVELNIYNGIPHLLSPVISDPKKAAGSLSWAVAEMERRFGLIEAVGARDITAYNRITKDDPDYEFMNRIVIIIDELADFMMTAPDEVEDSICRIAQKARAAGMHLIIGTQRPSVNVITGLIKANVPSRIAFAVSGQVDSRVILDKVGAETLIGRGDMLFSPIGALTPTRVQGAFVSEDDVEKVVSYIKNMNPETNGVYSEEVLKQIEEEAAKCGAGKRGSSAGGAISADEEGEAEDPMLKAAVELAVDSGKISTSFMQRKLHLGYGRAARLIDVMESLGYVSAPDGQSARKVLITKQQYMEMVLKDETPFE